MDAHDRWTQTFSGSSLETRHGRDKPPAAGITPTPEEQSGAPLLNPFYTPDLPDPSMRVRKRLLCYVAKFGWFLT